MSEMGPTKSGVIYIRFKNLTFSRKYSEGKTVCVGLFCLSARHIQTSTITLCSISIRNGTGTSARFCAVIGLVTQVAEEAYLATFGSTNKFGPEH